MRIRLGKAAELCSLDDRIALAVRHHLLPGGRSALPLYPIDREEIAYAAWWGAQQEPIEAKMAREGFKDAIRRSWEPYIAYSHRLTLRAQSLSALDTLLLLALNGILFGLPERFEERGVEIMGRKAVGWRLLADLAAQAHEQVSTYDAHTLTELYRFTAEDAGRGALYAEQTFAGLARQWQCLYNRPLKVYDAIRREVHKELPLTTA